MISVSVIIPALNEEAAIHAAATSAVTAGANEVIVADGGSTDATVERVQDIATVFACPQPGRAAQQNSGAELAGGDVLLFLHADCRLTPESISGLRECLSAHPDVVGGCFRQLIDAEGTGYRLLERGNAWRVRLLKWAYGDQGIFVRHEVFRALGGFPDMPLMEDLYFMKQLKRQGRIVMLQNPLIVSPRRWQQDGLLSRTLRNWGLILAAHLGVSKARLARSYPNDR